MTILDALFPAVPENTPNPNSKLLSSCLEIDKEKHIAIVGGGPAGVHMSACLAAKGYKVTLLESEQELGGKSLTIYDPLQPAVPQEMGTCYMHPGYTPIRKLLEEYDKDNLEINFANEKNGRMIFGLTLDDESKRKYTEGMEYFEWVFEQTEKRTTPACCRCLPDSLQGIPILTALTKYVRIHESIFGKYPYGLPPQPKDSEWSRINMTATEFLKKSPARVLFGALVFRWGLFHLPEPSIFQKATYAPASHGANTYKASDLSCMPNQRFGGS